MPESLASVAVKVNDFMFLLSPEEIEQANFLRKSETEFHLILGNRSVGVRLIHIDATGKKMTLEVDGESFQVEIRDALEQMLDKLGFSAVSAKQIKDIKAPMPGLVLDIHVTAGQEMAEGDKILILEAMKMENSLMIHTSAKIKAVLVKKGQAVETRCLLSLNRSWKI
jgi:acetyl/propionyl-CoA carboxylase alpha subunit